MLDSDWLIQNFLRSDWLPTRVAWLTTAAAADGEGYATEDVVAAAAPDCRGCATFNSASTTAAEIELALPVLLPKG